VRQFELWWADLPEPVGRRPVVLLTRTPALRYLSRVLVADVTTRVRGIAEEVRLGQAEGLPRPCVLNLDNLHQVPTVVLTARIGALATHRHVEVKRALGHALDWPELLEA
jgi:mRNA interferase MazF